MIDCDENGKMVSVSYSHEFRRMLGYHDTLDFPNTMKAWTDLLHPDDRDYAIKQLEEALKDKTNETKYNVEYRMKMADGTYQWFRDSAEVTRRLDGTACRMAGIFVNIEKNKFDSLKEKGSLFEDVERDCTWEELVQYYLKNYVYAEDREAVRVIYDKDYIEERFSKGIHELSLECRVMIDGQLRWVRNVILEDDREEKSRYLMVFIRDITDAKKEAEDVKELTRQNEAMDMLIQGTVKLVDRYAMCDLENDRYRFFNQNSDEMVYKAEGTYSEFVSAIEKKFKLLTTDISVKEAFSKEHIREMIQTPEDVYKFEYCTKGESQFKTIAICPLSWEKNQVARVLFISQDITQEKMVEIQSREALKEAYEAADRASKAKTEFLSNMSHDIRTPMNAIVGMTAIAGANIESQDRVIDCLSKITQSSRHLLGLINEVLDMSRIESGKISLSEEEFNLSELADNLVAMAMTGIEMHHHFEVHLNKIEHEDVSGDSLRIQQLITNIITNAIKYTPDGGNIYFGISEVETTSPDYGCYEFTIEVESKIGKGTKFTVKIYLKLQHKEIKRIDEFIDLPVLVVDDDKICCENTVRILEDIGIDGEWVTSGREAIEKVTQRYEKDENYFAIIIDWMMPEMDGIETTRQIRKQVGNDVTIIILSAYDYSEIEEEAREAVEKFASAPVGFYDLVFMDIQMPTMNGYEATAAIRSLRKYKAKEIPIVAMTANAFAEDVVMAKNAGMSEHIAKPLEMNRLCEIMQRYL